MKSSFPISDIAGSNPSVGHLASHAFWHSERKQFLAKHRRNPHRSLDPLYALPPALLEALKAVLPGWLSSDELAFEQDLAVQCRGSAAVAIFHDLPAKAPFLLPLSSDLSEDMFRRLGWDKFANLQRARFVLNLGSERVDVIHEQQEAYTGWLLTNPEFLDERDHLRGRWDHVVGAIKGFPGYPVRFTNEMKRQKLPKGARDVTDEFAGAFNAFYERWELLRFVTWDLPAPLGPNLSGSPYPRCLEQPPQRITIDLASHLHLPARFPLRAILAEIQKEQTPPHLRGWLAVQQQKHKNDLRYGRFRNIFRLGFYRDVVLASRYRDRFDGHVEALDKAFGRFLGDLEADTVKRLRMQLRGLRQRPQQ